MTGPVDGRKAETLIADVLSGACSVAGLEGVCTETELIGLRRARPVYARKQERLERGPRKRGFLGFLGLSVRCIKGLLWKPKAQ